MMRELVWIGLAEASRETCRLETGPDGVRVESVVDGPTGSCAYVLHASARWEFTSIVLHTSERSLEVRRTPEGWEVDGRARPDLAAAREVDISASPFSNTLPIRRLGLAIDASADIATAYIRVPELDVMSDPQRYTRVSESEYLYESLDSDFRRLIEVDADGLVVEYPGLFTRERG